MIISKTYPGLGYNQLDGSFWRLKKSLTLPRRVFPDESGYVSYKCAFTQQTVKRKASRIAWEILHDCPSNLLYIVHRNLDSSDYRGYNLLAINRQDYVKFKDASYNLDYCQMRATGKDAYSYTVSYKKDGKLKKKMLHDVVTALRFKRFLQYCALKYLGKYLNTA